MRLPRNTLRIRHSALPVALFAVGLSGIAVAEPPTDSQRSACATRYASAIQSHYDTVNDFSANFEQKTQSVTLGNASLGADAPSTGTVEFKKPGKMRWRYKTPMPSQVSCASGWSC